MPSLRFPLLALLVSLSVPSSFAGTISVAWNPVNHPELAGYRIHYRAASEPTPQSVDVGLVTAHTLSGLADCTEYLITVNAFDAEGVESTVRSNEVVGWARPTVVSVSPAVAERNSTVELVITGTNFQDGATVSFTDPGITVQEIGWNGCDRLTAHIGIGPAAALGPGDLLIVNPDQVFGAGSGLFGVTVDSTAPQISAVQADPIGATSATIGWTTNEPSDGSVFFRREGQSVYQQTPLEPMMVSEHSIVLTGLLDQSTYEFHVRSADTEGNASTSTDQTLATSKSDFFYLRFEAEAGAIGDPIERGAAAGGFADGWIRLSEQAAGGTAAEPSGTASYGFFVPRAANWRVWVRTDGPLDDGAWYERVDGALWAGVVSPSNEGWSWVSGRSYELAEGLHSLDLGGSRPGAKADRVLITDDPGFLPTEQPGDDVTPPAPVAGASAEAADGRNTLLWSVPANGGPLVLVIRYGTGGSPLTPIDGLPLLEVEAAAGSGQYVHSGLANETTYFYSVFVVDPSGNASAPAMLEATPRPEPPGPVENLHRTDKE